MCPSFHFGSVELKVLVRYTTMTSITKSGDLHTVDTHNIEEQ